MKYEVEANENETVPCNCSTTKDIRAWQKHVEASHSLPPLIAGTSDPSDKPLGKQNDLATSPITGFTLPVYYQFSMPPAHVRGAIIQRLADLIGSHEIPRTLRSFPSVFTKRLVSALSA